VETVAAGSYRTRTGSRAKGTEWNQIRGLPQRDALSVLVGHQYPLAIERRGLGAIHAAGQGCHDCARRSANHGYRLRAEVGHPDVCSVENWKVGVEPYGHRLDN